jgi:hypothetical protein
MKEEKEKAEAGAQANAEELEEVDGRVAGSWKAPHVEPPSDKALGWPGTKVWVTFVVIALSQAIRWRCNVLDLPKVTSYVFTYLWRTYLLTLALRMAK